MYFYPDEKVSVYHGFTDVLFLLIHCRKEGKRFGFAELHPKRQITSKEVPQQQVDTSDVEEEVTRIIETAEPMEQVYPCHSWLIE